MMRSALQSEDPCMTHKTEGAGGFHKSDSHGWSLMHMGIDGRGRPFLNTDTRG